MTAPLRILHVVGALNRGGVETWLMHVLRHIDRDRFRFDFLIHSDQPAAYDDEARALGARLIPCLRPAQPLAYGRNFRRILRQHGPYDAVHSHVYLFSGLVLFLARLHNIPVRVGHIYPTEDRQTSNQRGLQRALYRGVMAKSIIYNSTHILFDSVHAQEGFESLAGTNSSKFCVHYCGIDLQPFLNCTAANDLRQELDIPFGSKVVLHVGRFVPHKNHKHIIEIAQGVLKQRKDVVFLLVGVGPLHDEIRDAVSRRGLDSQFRFLPSYPDLAPIYHTADAFLFPSLMEGFGIVVVEAAASGLPIIASRIPGIIDSATASPFPVLVEPQNTDGFVAAILDAVEQPKEKFVPQSDLLARFDIKTSVANLSDIYTNA